MANKKNLDDIEPYQPGKPIEEVKRELAVEEVIKMASNENPLGPSPKALLAIKKNLETINHYPDGNCFYLKRALEKKWGLGEDYFVIGNGSDEIVMLIAATFLEEGDEAITGWPSFVIYPLVIKKFGGKVILVKLKDFCFDLPAIAQAITKKTKIIFIDNPNNPTGTIVTRQEVNKFLTDIPESVLVVFDEAYAEFVDSPSYPETVNLVKERPNILMLRTFSKSYGLAGLRIGYGIGQKETVGYLNKMREPFNVNRLAQVAATAALKDGEFLERTKDIIKAGRDYLYQALSERDIKYVPTMANFILIQMPMKGQEIFNEMLKDGVIVRPLKEYDLENYIRLTVGTPKQNKHFIQALDKILT